MPRNYTAGCSGDSSRSRATGSSGLGLAIVKALVEAHQGAIQLESAPGRTAFTIRLPLWAESDAPAVDGAQVAPAG